jgi:hypothetical protein
VKLNDREFGTMLAALAYWKKRDTNHSAIEEGFLASCNGTLEILNEKEIEQLYAKVFDAGKDMLTPTKKNFEYDIVSEYPISGGGLYDMEETLYKYGEDGWQLVNLKTCEDGRQVYTFMREK